MATLAPCLDELRDEVDHRWPHRSKNYDGWIGDTAHAARVSDHNPDASGMVHAIDVTAAGISVPQLLRETIGDPRAWYVIHDGTIYSRTHGWEARRYTGADPHRHHVHVSAQYADQLEADRSAWFEPNPPVTRRWVDLDQLVKAFRDEQGTTVHGDDDVLVFERALARRALLPRKLVDGKAGPRTRDAVRILERRLGSKPNGIPGRAVCRVLGLNPR